MSRLRFEREPPLSASVQEPTMRRKKVRRFG
jgi:hypothetical protein